MKTALVFGASGLVGSFLLNALLEHENYTRVIAVVRKPLNLRHSKLQILLGDLNTLPSLNNELVGNHVFIAIGTTKKKTPDEKEYYKIDHDYPVKAAAIAKAQGAELVSLVSAVGANTQSGLFYVRTKGETEQDIINLDYRYVQIFRPSMIMGNRVEHRPLEGLFIGIFKLINPLFGKSKFRGIEAKSIALSMIEAAQKPELGVAIHHWREMNQLLNVKTSKY